MSKKDFKCNKFVKLHEKRIEFFKSHCFHCEKEFTEDEISLGLRLCTSCINEQVKWWFEVAKKSEEVKVIKKCIIRRKNEKDY